MSAFIRRAWHQIEPTTPYLHGWCIDAIAAHLEAVTSGEIKRLILNVPPGSSKSLSTSVFWPSWEWGPQNMPGTRYIGTSYSERYAVRDNSRMRNLVSSEWYQDRWGNRVKLTKTGERKFENTAFGFRECIPFASLTSGRANRLIIDDPHSTESSLSEADREKATRIFLESVPTRLSNPVEDAIVIIMQRLHEEDLTGVALAKDLGYEHVLIPMEYEPTTHCRTAWFEDPRTERGELMFPERFPRKVVEDYKKSLGKWGSAAQLQQVPYPRGGGIVSADWWQLWEKDDPQDPEPLKFPRFDFTIASLDTAYTEKEENDFSAMTIWGVFKAKDTSLIQGPPTHMTGADRRLALKDRKVADYRAPKVMLIYAWQDRLSLHDLVERTAKACRFWKVDRLLIEAKASGISVSQELRRLYGGENWGVQLINPGQMDKVARVHSIAHIFADGMVYAPDRDWAQMVIDQFRSFPKTSHDDLVDSGSQAIKFLRDNGLLLHGHELEREWNEQARYKPQQLKPLYPTARI